MERGNEWSVRVTRGIGQRVAFYRNRADLTASMLSARCAELGLPMDRNVLAKLENGHRNSVTVDEVCVLAAALGVPPVMLLFGVGTEETAEILPGEHVPSFAAAEWFAGTAPRPSPGVVRSRRGWAWEPLSLYRDYEGNLAGEMSCLALAAEVARQAADVGESDRPGLLAAADGARDLARQYHDKIEEILGQLARGGWLLPASATRAPAAEDSR
jgi:transcriptional regulator with XRE-family HTH domain